MCEKVRKNRRVRTTLTLSTKQHCALNNLFTKFEIINKHDDELV